jgi:hypothetical protein
MNPRDRVRLRHLADALNSAIRFAHGRGRSDQEVARACDAALDEIFSTLLVAQALDRLGVPAAHIPGDGGLETHYDPMDRLLDSTGLPHQDLLRTRDELLPQALARQEEKVAYVDEALAATASTSRDTQ